MTQFGPMYVPLPILTGTWTTAFESMKTFSLVTTRPIRRAPPRIRVFALRRPLFSTKAEASISALVKLLTSAELVLCDLIEFGHEP